MARFNEGAAGPRTPGLGAPDPAERIRRVTGERRALTVLFCDLVGSTPLGEQLDAEDYADVLFEYQERGRAAIEARGGGVAHFAGDGILAYFGHPIAHEDDADRAVAAAFDLLAVVREMALRRRRELGVELRCRIGMHAALAVVGRMEGRYEVSVFGAGTNLAARVQAEAEPDEILATADLARMLRGRYLITDARTVELRGIAEAVELVRLAASLGPHEPVPSRPLVGRDEPLARLRQRRREAHDGRGGAVEIAGPAGIGKSTLVAALVADEPAGTVIEVRGRELTMQTPFATLGELAEGLRAGTVGDDDLTSALDALEHAMAADDHGVNAQQVRQRILDSARALGSRLGARLVVVEDAHWVDASSRAALAAMSDEFASTSTLLVATSRPPAGLPGEVIELAPLSPSEIAELVGEIDAPQLATIVARSGGIPLFATELARTAGSAGGRLPPSLHGSLLARLDRVPEHVEVARAASVLGDEVDVALLAAMTEHTTAEVDDALEDLVAGDVIHPRTGGWGFAHALLRDAIYESVLSGRRRQLHERAAVELAARGAQDDDRVAVLGHHYEHAGARAQAARCFGAAARRSAGRGAVDEALALAERGLRVVDEETDPALALGLTMTKGNARLAVEGYAAPRLVELWQSAEQLARAAEDRLELSSAMNGQSVAALFDGDYRLSVARAERVRVFGERTHDRAALVRGHCSLALAQVWLGDVPAAYDNAVRADELYERGDDQLLTYGFGTDHAVIARSTAALASWMSGTDDAERWTASAIEWATEIDSPISAATAVAQAAIIDLDAERYHEVLERTELVEELAERYGMPLYRGVSRLLSAAAMARLGQAGALRRADDALGILMSSGGAFGATAGLLQLAHCQLAHDPAQAAATAAYGLTMARSTGELLFEVQLAMLVAECRGDEESWLDLERAAAAAAQRGALGSAARGRARLDGGR